MGLTASTDPLHPLWSSFTPRRGQLSSQNPLRFTGAGRGAGSLVRRVRRWCDGVRSSLVRVRRGLALRDAITKVVHLAVNGVEGRRRRCSRIGRRPLPLFLYRRCSFFLTPRLALDKTLGAHLVKRAGGAALPLVDTGLRFRRARPRRLKCGSSTLSVIDSEFASR